MRDLKKLITSYIEKHEAIGREYKDRVVADFVLHAECTRAERRAILRWIGETYCLLYQGMQRECPRLFEERECAISYTTAPKEYDGFGTEELAMVGTLNGKPLRKIETPVEHVQWQHMRNGSGLHPSYDEAGFLDLLDRPWYVKLVEEVTHE